jgi:hypothetical protein
MNYPIMGQTDVDYLARKERTKDLLRAAERERLIQTTRPKQPTLRSSIGRWLAELAAGQPERSQSDSVMAEHQP